MLGPYADFSIVAESHDGASALQLVYEHRPDVVLLDAEWPDAHGTQVAREIRAQRTEVKIVLVSAFPLQHDSDGLGPVQAEFEYIPKEDFSVSRLREVAGNKGP